MWLVNKQRWQQRCQNVSCPVRSSGNMYRIMPTAKGKGARQKKEVHKKDEEKIT